MADLSVAGRQFRTQADYNAALRDQKQIEAIKAKVNMEQPGEVISLYEDLKAGKYRLMTLVGRGRRNCLFSKSRSIAYPSLLISQILFNTGREIQETRL